MSALEKLHNLAELLFDVAPQGPFSSDFLSMGIVAAALTKAKNAVIKEGKEDVPLSGQDLSDTEKAIMVKVFAQSLEACIYE